MMHEKDKIPIGISSCLLGESVRFNGGHKHDKYITGTLGQYFEWIPVCPEVELGLGTPRPTLRLELRDKNPHLIQPKTEADITSQMEKYASKRIKKIQKQSIYGYILKSKSPSCGMGKVKIYRGHGVSPLHSGIGLFAKHLMEAIPNLPVEEEGRLCDPALRENWVSRVFAYYVFQTQVVNRPTVGKLVEFHSTHKFSILSHCEVTYRKLGVIVAEAKKRPIKTVVSEYENLFMTALKKRSTIAKNVNVMQHMVGFFKKKLNSLTKQQIAAVILDYRNGIVPIIVPITLIKHYSTILDIEYLLQQSYLGPHPKELALMTRI